MSTTKYMLDTNVFNRLVDGRFDLTWLADKAIVVTHTQRDELLATPKDERRTALLEIFEWVGPDLVPTENFVWDVSRWDNSKWASEDTRFTEMHIRLGELDKKAGKNSTPSNVTRDILVLETAIVQKFTLVTGDANLAKVCREFGGQVIEV